MPPITIIISTALPNVTNAACFRGHRLLDAIINPRDALRAAATKLIRDLGEPPLVTTEMVLVEVLNALGGNGEPLRPAAATLAQEVIDDPAVELVPQTARLFRRALALYRDRPDKDWSLTDCASFLIMEEHKISDALTHDRHFEQYGFHALLRD